MSSSRFVLALVASAMLLGATAQTGAEETGHRLHHDNHYRFWKQPGTDVSCCSDHDCAPVKAELRQGRWYALWLREWIAVPDTRIIRERNPTIEGGHLCYSDGKVVCFLPPDTGG